MKMLDSGDVSDHPYQTQFQAFFDALEQGRTCRSRVSTDAFKTHRVIAGGDKSTEEGRPVKACRNPDEIEREERRRVARVLAIAAHPDDIEFMMAGTLLLLGDAGWDIHYMNVSTGNLGQHDALAGGNGASAPAEAQNAARMMAPVWHPPFCNDLASLL